MKGINYLTDTKGERPAVVFDLKKYREELEDFIDGLEAAARVNEPGADFEKAVNKIIKSKSLNGLPHHHKKIG